MQNQSIQSNGKGEVSIVVVIAIIVIIAMLFLFFTGFFAEENEDTIQIDPDNTEIVVEKEDLKEIESRLDELDIDLDDILNELEF